MLERVNKSVPEVMIDLRPLCKDILDQLDDCIDKYYSHLNGDPYLTKKDKDKLSKLIDDLSLLLDSLNYYRSTWK